jgi:predicted Zn-dependent peptidase
MSWLVLLLLGFAEATETDLAEPAPSEEGAVLEEEAPAPAAAPDRSQPPPVLPPAPLVLAEPEIWALTPSVTVHLVRVPAVRKVNARAWLHRGSLDLDGLPSHSAWMTGWLQDVATETHQADALALVKDLKDIDVWSSGVGFRKGSLTLEAPREALEDGLALFGEVLRTPRYPNDALRQYKSIREYWYLADGPSRPSAVAETLLGYAWYPPDSPYGARPDLWELSAVRRRALRDRHLRLLAEAPMTVLVVGDVTRADVEGPLAEAFSDLGEPGEPEPMPPFDGPVESVVYAVDMPDQEQATIGVRFAAASVKHPDRIGLEVVDWALGGHFLSRLNKNLREEKGLTYGAGSSLSIGQTHGTWTASVEVSAENTAIAIREIEREIMRVVQEGVTAEEVDAAWREWVSDWNTVQQTAGSAFGFYVDLFESQRTLEEVRGELDAVAALTPEATRRIAADWLGPDQTRIWVVVGNREVIESQLGALGGEVRWVTPAQAILGDLEE